MIVPRSGLAGHVLSFARALRQHGAGATIGQSLAAAHALSLTGLASRRDVKNALKTCLISKREEAAVFDYWFDVYFSGLDRTPPAAPASEGPLDTDFRQHTERDTAGDDGRDGPSAALHFGASLTELAARRDFARLEPGEVRDLLEQVRSMARRLGARLKRRLGRTGRRAAIDFRRTFRASLQQGGELIDLKQRRIKPRKARLVLLADISGSMTPYARFFLTFMFGLSQAMPRTEAFVFSTSLVRVTRELTRTPAGQVLENLTKAGLPFSGGTDIGGSLEYFLSRFGSGLLTRRAIVFILSDGWDRGRPERLKAAMKRLRREAGTIFWLNPLAADPDYEPLAMGMATALPFVDELAPFSRLADIRRLAQMIGGAVSMGSKR